MNISRRWFLKSAVMAAVATQLPFKAEGHRVLFIDDGGLLVSDYTLVDGIIRAKVVNGMWDLVLDINKKMQYAYSNPAYGIDNEARLVDSNTYNTLVEVFVSKSIGDVPDELKPYKYMQGKYEIVNGEWEPVMIEKTSAFDGKPFLQMNPWTGEMEDRGGGTLKWTCWEHEKEEVTVDPLHGAGVNYNAVLEEARRQKA